MTKFDWARKEDGFWYVIVDLDEGALPPLAGKGISRSRNAAVAYALEELAEQLKKTPEDE